MAASGVRVRTSSLRFAHSDANRATRPLRGEEDGHRELEEAIGASATERALRYGQEAGLEGPLTGQWIERRVLEFVVGGTPVLRHVDRDSDQRADEALVRPSR